MFQVVESQLWELATERAMFSLSPETIGLRGRCLFSALGIVATLGDLTECDLTLLGVNAANCLTSAPFLYLLVCDREIIYSEYAGDIFAFQSSGPKQFPSFKSAHRLAVKYLSRGSSAYVTALEESYQRHLAMLFQSEKSGVVAKLCNQDLSPLYYPEVLSVIVAYFLRSVRFFLKEFKDTPWCDIPRSHHVVVALEQSFLLLMWAILTHRYSFLHCPICSIRYLFH